MSFDAEVEQEFRERYPQVGFFYLWKIAGLWINDERQLLNEKEWNEPGSVLEGTPKSVHPGTPGRLVDVGVPYAVDHILHNDEIWKVYQDKVPNELRHDKGFRLELINLGLFRDETGMPYETRSSDIQEHPERKTAYEHLERSNGTPIVKQQIHDYWVQEDMRRYGIRRVPDEYVDKTMVHHYCIMHDITPLENKILKHLSLS
jgi:hypothetical protein